LPPEPRPLSQRELEVAAEMLRNQQTAQHPLGEELDSQAIEDLSLALREKIVVVTEDPVGPKILESDDMVRYSWIQGDDLPRPQEAVVTYTEARSQENQLHDSAPGVPSEGEPRCSTPDDTIIAEPPLQTTLATNASSYLQADSSETTAPARRPSSKALRDWWKTL